MKLSKYKPIIDNTKARMKKSARTSFDLLHIGDDIRCIMEGQDVATVLQI